jgi:hypothetical protein
MTGKSWNHRRNLPCSSFARQAPSTLVACLALGVVLVSATAAATTVTVNTTTPDNATDGRCGWVEAVQAVNQASSYRNCAYVSDGQADRIVLPAGTHAGPGATLVRSVTIVGAGQSSTIIRSTASCTICSFGGPNGSAQSIGLTNLTLQSASSSTSSVFGVFISARTPVSFSADTVLVTGFGTAGIDLSNFAVDLSNSAVVGTLTRTTIDRNALGVGCADCTLLVTESAITNNTRSGIRLRQRTPRYNYLYRTTIENNSYDGDGGGISATSTADSDDFPTLDIAYSTLRGNHAGGRGGGIFASTRVRFESTVIDGNTADVWGGGIAAVGSSAGFTEIAFDNAVLNANRAPLGGGAVFDDGSFPMVTESTISNNVATATNGGGFALFGVNSGGVNLNGALVAGNRADQGHGGGVFNSSAHNAYYNNTTFTGNSAAMGGGFWHEGGNSGVGEIHMRHCTVANNTATQHSGGLHVDISNPIVAYNIIINNSAPSSPDASFNTTTVKFGPFNMVRSALQAFFPAGQQNVILSAAANSGVDTVLRSLGGPTQVIRLSPGSPAIDKIPSPPPLPTDQRGFGFARPQFGGVDATKADIGAFELSRLETEVLPVAAKSPGINHVVVTNGSASNGAGTQLQATASTQFVTYSSGGVLSAGNYRVTIGFKKGSTAGQVQFSAGPTASGPWITFATQNARAASDSWTTVSFGVITAATTSTKFFRFLVPNGATAPVQIFPDFVEFTRQ